MIHFFLRVLFFSMARADGKMRAARVAKRGESW